MSAEASTKRYVKIYFILLGLLVVSLIGPEIGIQWITLITAFGIAIVKAYIVVAEYMHLKIEKRVVIYMMAVSLVMVFAFFIGSAPDVLSHKAEPWSRDGTVISGNCIASKNEHFTCVKQRRQLLEEE